MGSAIFLLPLLIHSSLVQLARDLNSSGYPPCDCALQREECKEFCLRRAGKSRMGGRRTAIRRNVPMEAVVEKPAPTRRVKGLRVEKEPTPREVAVTNRPYIRFLEKNLSRNMGAQEDAETQRRLYRRDGRLVYFRDKMYNTCDLHGWANRNRGASLGGDQRILFDHILDDTGIDELCQPMQAPSLLVTSTLVLTTTTQRTVYRTVVEAPPDRRGNVSGDLYSSCDPSCQSDEGRYVLANIPAIREPPAINPIINPIISPFVIPQMGDRGNEVVEIHHHLGKAPSASTETLTLRETLTRTVGAAPPSTMSAEHSRPVEKRTETVTKTLRRTVAQESSSSQAVRTVTVEKEAPQAVRTVMVSIAADKESSSSSQAARTVTVEKEAPQAVRTVMVSIAADKESSSSSQAVRTVTVEEKPAPSLQSVKTVTIERRHTIDASSRGTDPTSLRILEKMERLINAIEARSSAPPGSFIISTIHRASSTSSVIHSSTEPGRTNFKTTSTVTRARTLFRTARKESSTSAPAGEESASILQKRNSEISALIEMVQSHRLREASSRPLEASSTPVLSEASTSSVEPETVREEEEDVDELYNELKEERKRDEELLSILKLMHARRKRESELDRLMGELSSMRREASTTWPTGESTHHGRRSSNLVGARVRRPAIASGLVKMSGMAGSGKPWHKKLSMVTYLSKEADASREGSASKSEPASAGKPAKEAREDAGKTVTETMYVTVKRTALKARTLTKSEKKTVRITVDGGSGSSVVIPEVRDMNSRLDAYFSKIDNIEKAVRSPGKKDEDGGKDFAIYTTYILGGRGDSVPSGMHGTENPAPDVSSTSSARHPVSASSVSSSISSSYSLKPILSHVSIRSSRSGSSSVESLGSSQSNPKASKSRSIEAEGGSPKVININVAFNVPLPRAVVRPEEILRSKGAPSSASSPSAMSSTGSVLSTAPFPGISSSVDTSSMSSSSSQPSSSMYIQASSDSISAAQSSLLIPSISRVVSISTVVSTAFMRSTTTVVSTKTVQESTASQPPATQWPAAQPSPASRAVSPEMSTKNKSVPPMETIHIRATNSTISSIDDIVTKIHNREIPEDTLIISEDKVIDRIVKELEPLVENSINSEEGVEVRVSGA
jgi:hypothetical protein